MLDILRVGWYTSHSRCAGGRALIHFVCQSQTYCHISFICHCSIHLFTSHPLYDPIVKQCRHFGLPIHPDVGREFLCMRFLENDKKKIKQLICREMIDNVNKQMYIIMLLLHICYVQYAPRMLLRVFRTPSPFIKNKIKHFTQKKDSVILFKIHMYTCKCNSKGR